MTAMTMKAPLYDDYAWLIGEDAPRTGLSNAERRLRENRIAAAMFRGRFRLLIAWRRQAASRSSIAVGRTSLTAPAPSAVAISSDLPSSIRPLREEIAIWRSFIAADIHDILFGPN